MAEAALFPSMVQLSLPNRKPLPTIDPDGGTSVIVPGYEVYPVARLNTVNVKLSHCACK